MERLKSVQSLLFSVQDHMCSSDADDDCDDDSDEYVLTMGFANYIERSIGSTLKHQEELENLGSDEEDEEDYTEEDDDEKRKKR